MEFTMRGYEDRGLKERVADLTASSAAIATVTLEWGHDRSARPCPLSARHEEEPKNRSETSSFPERAGYESRRNGPVPTVLPGPTANGGYLAGSRIIDLPYPLR